MLLPEVFSEGEIEERSAVGSVVCPGIPGHPVTTVTNYGASVVSVKKNI